MRFPSATKRRLQAFFLALICVSPLANAALLTLSPDVVTAGTGDALSFDLVVSDLGNFGPASVGAFDVTVDFDPAVMSFASYSLGNLLGDPLLVEALDLGAIDLGGAVNLGEVSLLSALALDALQPGEFVLATLTFDVLLLEAGGVTQLSVNPSSLLADALGRQLAIVDAGGAVIEGKRATVPNPGTITLLLLGLLGWRATTRAARVKL